MEEAKQAISCWENLDGYFLSFHYDSESFSLIYRDLDSVPIEVKKFYKKYSNKYNKGRP